MDWLKIEPLDLPGREAAAINRCVAALLAFRADIETPDDAPTSAPKFFRTDDRTNEALRREYMLRLKIAKVLGKQQQPAEENAAALATLNQQLIEREGHRTGGRV